MIYNERYHGDHGYVDQKYGHCHFMVPNKSGEAICIDVYRTAAGSVFAVGWFGDGLPGMDSVPSSLKETLDKKLAAQSQKKAA